MLGGGSKVARVGTAVAAALVVVASVGLLIPVEALQCRNKLAQTPPMGWMSWEIFRCNVDCETNPKACINADLYKSMGDAMKKHGFLDAGYDTVHVDDCWMTRERDPKTGRLTANSTRFPGGMKPVADHLHSLGLKFGLYTAESPHTCAGYPASYFNEVLDAETFASWGVDYLKVDGCGDHSYYPTGYTAMGTALQISGRDIVYSCSWPAYLGGNETAKPFDTMIAVGCNLWRNWRDIQCSWKSLITIIDHWGDYGDVMARNAGPGHWNDPDMLLIGNPCITDDQARTQMAIWSVVAAPLIMGNDVRNMTNTTRAILLNRDAIAVNQDKLGKQGTRITPKAQTEVWARNLSDAAVAVALLNKGSSSSSSNNNNSQGEPSSRRGQEKMLTPLSYEEQMVMREEVTGGAATITVTLKQIGITSSHAEVLDIWTGAKSVVTGSYSASVPPGGTAFVRVTPKQ